MSHPHHQPSKPPLPVQAALAPLRLANTAFALACKVTLGPLRAVLGQRIPLSNRRHLVLLPERVEKLLGTQTFFKVCRFPRRAAAFRSPASSTSSVSNCYRCRRVELLAFTWQSSSPDRF